MRFQVHSRVTGYDVGQPRSQASGHPAAQVAGGVEGREQGHAWHHVRRHASGRIAGGPCPGNGNQGMMIFWEMLSEGRQTK